MQKQQQWCDYPNVYNHSGELSTSAISPDSKTMATGQTNGGIYIWNIVDSTELFKLKPHTNTVISLHFSENTKWLASGGFDCSIYILNCSDYSIYAQFQNAHQQCLRQVLFDKNSEFLYSVGDDSQINIWNVSDKALHMNINQQAGSICSISLTNDSSYFVTSGVQGQLKIYNTHNYKQIKSIRTPCSYSTKFLPKNNKCILSGLGGGGILLIDQSSRKLIRKYPSFHDDFLLGIAVSPDDQLVASFGKSAEINIYCISTGELLQTIDAGWSIRKVCFPPDNSFISVACRGQEIKQYKKIQ